MVRHFTLLPSVKISLGYLCITTCTSQRGLRPLRHLVGSVCMPYCSSAPFGYSLTFYYTKPIMSQPQTFHGIHKHPVHRSPEVEFRIGTKCPFCLTQSCSQTLKTYVDMFSGSYNLRASNSDPKYLPP